MNLKKQWKRGKDKVKNAVRHPKKAAKEAIKAGKKAVKKAEKLAKKVDKAAEKITRPVTKPIAKVLAPVIKPVAKPLAKVLKPVNKILKPLNAVLTPVKILTGNGTILDVVTAVAKELVISAPISNALNRVLNPIDAIIQDATKPIALLTTTVANTQNLVSNVAQIKKNLTPPAPVKQKATQTTKGEIPAKKPTPVKPAPSQTGQVAGNLSKEQKQNEIYRKNVQKPTASTQPSPVPPKAAPVTQKSTQANNVETPATKPAPAKSTPSQARQPASNLTKEQKQNEIYQRKNQQPAASTQSSPAAPKTATVIQKSTQTKKVETPATKPAPAKPAPSQSSPEARKSVPVSAARPASANSTASQAKQTPIVTSQSTSTKQILQQLPPKAAVPEEHHPGALHIASEAASIVEKTAHIMRKHLPKAIDLTGKALEVTTAIVEHPAKNVVQQVVCNGTAEVVKIALTGAIMTPVVVPATAAGTAASGPIGGVAAALTAAAALQQPLNNVTEPAAQVIRNGCNTLFEAGREISNTNSKAVKGALEKITEAAKHINLTH